MCVNELPEVALNSAAAGIGSAVSNRKSNAPNHCATELHLIVQYELIKKETNYFY